MNHICLSPKNIIKIYKNTKLFSTTSIHKWGINRQADISEFEKLSLVTIKEIESFFLNLSSRQVIPNVKPDFLKNKLIVKEINSNPTDFNNIFHELNTSILPYMTLWSHPGFLNWYPSMTSFPAILGNFISNSFENPGSNYQFNKTQFKLEEKVMTWLVDLLNLPSCFKTEKAGATVHFAAGECSVIAALAGRMNKKIELEINGESNKERDFVFYYSSQAHYSVKKGINIVGYNGREIKTKWSEEYKNFTMDISDLNQKINEDILQGKIPTYICLTLGTTSTSALDDAESIIKIAKQYKMWCHVDAAYTGNTFMLEDYKSLANSIEGCSSLVINGNKWMPVSENAGYFFTSNYISVMKAFNDLLSINQLKKMKNSYIDWEIMSGRSNKSLRLYMVFSCFGKNCLKDIVKRTISAAKVFEKRLVKSGYFDIVTKTRFALVCFRLIGKSKIDHQRFYEDINKDGKYSIGPYDVPDVEGEKSYILRISINYVYVTDQQSEIDCDYIISSYEKMFNIKSIN